MDRAHGIDISKWQYPYTPAANPPRPVDFIIQRTSYGKMRDERYAELTPIVLKFPVRGAYHYASSAVPWKEQADLFLALTEEHDFIAWDFEKGYNVQSSSYVYGCVEALNYLKRESGKPVLLYCNPDTWATWLKDVQADLLNHELWVAQYMKLRALRNPDGSPLLAKTMRRDWRFWQYDDKGMVGDKGKLFGASSYGLDLDVYNGTFDDLWAWLHPATNPEPPRCPTCGQLLP